MTEVDRMERLYVMATKVERQALLVSIEHEDADPDYLALKATELRRATLSVILGEDP